MTDPGTDTRVDPRITQLAPRTIIICRYGDDIREWTFPIKPVPPTKTGRTKILPKRATVGPPNPDRDDTLSTLNLVDLSGGQGVYRINPATDIGHSWWHIATAEGTDGWTGARETIADQPASFTGDCVPVGRIGGRAYALWGTALHAWDPDALAWGPAQQTIGVVPPESREGIATFDSKMYFPLGAAGYASIDEATLGTLNAPTFVTGAATPTDNTGPPHPNPRVHLFCPHNNLLWAITTEDEGYRLCNSFTGTSGDWDWKFVTGKQEFTKVQKSFKPRAMAVFPNAQQQKALWVSGRGGLMVFDPNQDESWTETQLTDPPPHPDFGRAMKVFRPGEALWITGGGGDVFKYTSNGNTVPASGPGGANEGMPADKRGDCVSWASDLAHLYGLFKGDMNIAASPSITEDSPTGDPLYIPADISNSTVIAQTGKGWHPVWESASAGAPTKIVVVDSERDDGSIDYRAFWGQGDLCWSMQCRLFTTSARQSILANLGERFAVTTELAPNAGGYIDWGEFDGGSYAIRKLVSHVGIDMDLASDVDKVEFQYYTSDSDIQNWQTLGEATIDSLTPGSNGRTILPFGAIAEGSPSVTVFSEGEPCWWIRQRLRWITQTPTRPAIVRSVSMAFMPLPQDAATKTYQVLLPTGGGVDQETKQTAEMITRKLESLVESEHFLFMQDGQKKYRAYVASVSYSHSGNPDAPGVLNLTVLQIPTGIDTLTGEGPTWPV